MSCIGGLYRTWLKYRWVVACILAFLVLLLYANNNSYHQGWKIAAKDHFIATLSANIGQKNLEIGNATTQLVKNSQLINQMKEEIELCNMSLHNEIQTNAKQRKYAMELYNNHTKVLEYRCIQRINKELDEVKNQTRVVTDEKEHRVKNCDQQLIEMKRNISGKDEIISQKDSELHNLNNKIGRKVDELNNRDNDINKLQTDVQNLRRNLSSKNDEIWQLQQNLTFENDQKIMRMNNELYNEKIELQWYKEYYPYV